MFISLKPLAERGGRTTQQVINRLRKELAAIQGLSVFMNPAARHPHGRAVGQVDVPVHAVGYRHRRALRLGAEASSRS